MRSATTPNREMSTEEDLVTVRADGRPVVVGVATPGGEGAAVTFAADEARLSECGLRLVHAFTVPPGPPDAIADVYGVDVAGSFRDFGQAVLDTASTVACARARARSSVLDVDTVLARGAAARVLTEQSSTARLVVLGPDECRPWFLRLFTSRVSRTLVGSARCPVVVVPDTWVARGPRDAVTLLVDGSTVAHGPFRFAFDHAARHDLPLHVVHLSEPGGAPRVAISWHDMSRLIETWGRRYPDVLTDVVVVRGRADADTVASLRSSGLLVLGRPHRQDLAATVHDSLARTMIRQAHGPVAVAVVPGDHDG